MDFSNLNGIEGLQFMPVLNTKQPIIKGWQTAIKKYDLSNCEAVGIVCGIPSNNLEVIDCDEKYSLDGNLFINYKKAVHAADPLLLKKLVIAKTKNKGYHVIFRCDKIEGNLKLANRPTTEKELEDTYNKSYESESLKGKTDDEAKKVAEKSKANDKVRVLLETRGIGGFIMCFPSDGYELMFGDYYSIEKITELERETLFTVARQFNEIMDEVHIPRTYKTVKTEGISPFEDYDNKVDVVQLLESNGWKFVKNKGSKALMLRPGTSSAVTSGNYDYSLKKFSVFTTSTEFEPQKGYSPYAVFTYLECNKDFSEASRKLFEMGFGERASTKEKKEYQSSRKIPSRINEEDDDFSFLATNEDYDSYLQQVIDGTLPMGLTTGCPSLDEHFLYKEGNLVMINGTDNVGKSVFMWWLLMIAALYHGWQGIIFSSENTLGSFMRKMIQFYWGKPLRGKFAMSKEEFEIAKLFVEKHFILIKSQEDLYNYKDIINMVKKSKKKYPNLKYGMIDPYNSLKMDLSGFSKLNTHDYHYEAASEIKAFGQKNKFGWYINMHAITAAARAKDGEKKYPVAPGKADTEGGQKFPNKADDFATVHRLVGHPTDYMITEFHVRKIKETDTGGRVTSIDSPVKFEMYKGGCGFIERLEMGGYPVDPIEAWHRKKGETIQQELIPNVTWRPNSSDEDSDVPF